MTEMELTTARAKGALVLLVLSLHSRNTTLRIYGIEKLVLDPYYTSKDISPVKTASKILSSDLNLVPVERWQILQQRDRQLHVLQLISQMVVLSLWRTV